MAIQLVAGQSIAADFTLLHPIESSGRDQLWLALQESTQERVQVEVLEHVIDLTRVQNSLDQYKALIHPNILPGYRVVEVEDSYCLISAYRRNLQPLNLQQPLSKLWPQLKVIIEALEYAHSLGFAHTRLTPNDCLVGDDGTVYVKGFGLPKTPGAYIVADQNPSAQSDLYSIAQIIFACLTGAPLPDQLVDAALRDPGHEHDDVLSALLGRGDGEHVRRTPVLDGSTGRSSRSRDVGVLPLRPAGRARPQLCRNNGSARHARTDL